MLRSLRTVCLLAVTSHAFFTVPKAHAEPWIDTSDQFLRADIQRLADAGVITVPINTYPLMWSGITRNLKSADISELSPDIAEVVARVNYRYQQTQEQPFKSEIKAAATSKDKRFTSFGEPHRERASLSVSNSGSSDYFAYKVAASAHYDASDNHTYRLDDSYAALLLGNWVVSAGLVSSWWGPGNDQNLHRTNNARPLPGLTLSRNDPQAFETPWLSWLGEWNFTGSMSRLESDRAIANPYLLQMRGTLRPLRQLELGFSLTNQMCGEGIDCSLSDIWDSLVGGGNCTDGTNDCDSSTKSHKGNKIAGFDVRYSDTWFGQPIGIYFERTCEDNAGPYPWQIADCGRQLGVDTWLNIGDSVNKVYLEASDTLVACGTNANVFNCFYEHSEYLGGYRYYQRSIGSSYDSDARTLVLGVISQTPTYQVETKVRWLQLNKDGGHRNPDYTPYQPKENLVSISSQVGRETFMGRVNLGAEVRQSEIAETAKRSTQALIFADLTYPF
ncbi:outer membrane protein in capsule/EPS biosynthesis locus [Paraferrimonas haliotis]|uniref:Outer membrane protein in capsule/EPS biosynthesis locus n=1 Tax=Paraferrimonas haliotis TaxID=2013866 RepID=A0AA37TJZ8_9GAMM|nr:outer membrane protein in capsule/EPS biosynthesis locus [Paraferrimonas haliotis]